MVLYFRATIILFTYKKPLKLNKQVDYDQQKNIYSKIKIIISL